ncbi:MAG TPA: 2-C-methyl-D-erythritol 4-phosphate cytidylyltransferase [Spirochaetota bacterium]|nr:2-C-methyl-D-erythritol 4-phosphate cytidylyltransferase [Spirochaetota bacterium]
MITTYAIILAGGRGLRLAAKTPKQFLPLGGKPVIAWSLELCENLSEVSHILVVVPGEFIPQIDSLIKTHGITKHIMTVPGGATRQESAYHALAAVNFADTDLLIFHDAARPFVSPETMQVCIAAAQEHGAAAAYVPVHDTIAVIDDNFVTSVPLRDRMYYAQTPQGFRFSIIKAAHEKARKERRSGTDDVSLVLAAGFRVKMIDGDYSNFKITTDYDYQAACGIAETNHSRPRR